MTNRSAKFAAAAALLYLPLQAYGQTIDLTPYAGRYLSDPNFLPLAGQVYGTTSYTHGWTDGSSANAFGVATSDFHTNTNTLGQLLSFGITDDLSVNGSVEYVPVNNREIDYANGRSASVDSSGFSEPIFGATWRARGHDGAPARTELQFRAGRIRRFRYLLPMISTTTAARSMTIRRRTR